MEAAFHGNNSKLKCKVEDVFVVPDYQTFFESAIDKLFGRMHKKEWTQHQYRFEAVTIAGDNYFPHGAKFTYRKYACDKVVVIDKKPILSCRTPVGILTGKLYKQTTHSVIYTIFIMNNIIICILLLNTLGLEPKTVLSQWYPHRGLYGRDVEGMHLLLEVPSIPLNQLKLQPKSLVPGCVKVFTDLRSDINKHYNVDSNDRKSWNEWFRMHAPVNEEVSMYVRSHKYLCPLIQIFRSGFQLNPTWVPQAPRCSFSIFPSNVVIATPSIRCRFNRSGAPTPFVTIENDSDLGNEISPISRYTRFKENELSRLKKLKLSGLKSALNRKMKENGARFPVSGLLDTLCLLVFECNVQYISTRYKTNVLIIINVLIISELATLLQARSGNRCGRYAVD